MVGVVGFLTCEMQMYPGRGPALSACKLTYWMAMGNTLLTCFFCVHQFSVLSSAQLYSRSQDNQQYMGSQLTSQPKNVAHKRNNVTFLLAYQQSVCRRLLNISKCIFPCKVFCRSEPLKQEPRKIPSLQMGWTSFSFHWSWLRQMQKWWFEWKI